MKLFFLFLAGILILSAGFFLGRSQTLLLGQNTTAQNPTPTIAQQIYMLPTDVPSPTSNPLSQGYAGQAININTTSQTGSGPQNDIIEVQQITASQQTGQIGDDISFTVTIKNQSPNKKNIQAICFNSSESNFGCTQGKNLAPGEIFNVNNTGRFHSPGTKSVWITWSQDNLTFFRPINAGTAQVTIQ